MSLPRQSAGFPSLVRSFYIIRIQYDPITTCVIERKFTTILDSVQPHTKVGKACKTFLFFDPL